MMDRFKYIINILIVAALIGAIAIGRDGRLVGESVDELFKDSDSSSEVVDIESILADGTLVINTTSLADGIVGFGGRTPIKLYIKDGIITTVEYEKNNETPSFFGEVISSGIFSRWSGMTLEEAISAEVDIVSGATYSSAAIIENVRSAAAYGASVEATSGRRGFDLKVIIGVLVILSGAAITLFGSKIKENRYLVTIQHLLNVVVLGFWCGSFLSLSQFVAWLSNGFNLTVGALTIVLLGVVVAMPLIGGRKGSYCQIHCPMGSAQALLDKVKTPKLKFPPRVNSTLNKLRYYILLTLLFMMWCGVGFEIMDYEIFSAFIVSSASIVVLVMAVIFLVLSLFITKPYCRFICPTGALLTIMQKTKE